MNLLTSLLEFAVENRRILIVAALITACGLYRNALLNEEHEHDADNTLHRLQIADSQRKTQAAQIQNKEANHAANTNIPIAVDKARLNAGENYRRHFGIVGGNVAGNLGGGVVGSPNVGMRESGDNARTLQTDSAESPAKESASMDASCASEFIGDAAEASVILNGRMEWARANQLPFEK